MQSKDGRFRRTELMLGEEACARLRNSFVVVVGLGAVGSYALEGLARSGVGKLRLVDFDKVAPSNINRQLLALESTIGLRKCDLAKTRVLDINPNCQVECLPMFVDGENVWECIEGSPDIVIDAIDALNPKTDLIQAVRSKGIPLISCLGAALRFDPSRVRVAPLGDVKNCPLGRAVRQRLRRRGVVLDYPCVYSEEPLPRPLPLARPTEESGPYPTEQPTMERGRVRNTLGSLPTITGIFGLTAANVAIRMLSGLEDSVISS